MNLEITHEEREFLFYALEAYKNQARDILYEPNKNLSHSQYSHLEHIQSKSKNLMDRLTKLK